MPVPTSNLDLLVDGRPEYELVQVGVMEVRAQARPTLLRAG